MESVGGIELLRRGVQGFLKVVYTKSRISSAFAYGAARDSLKLIFN
jgi:hypothetical protein